MTRFKDELPTQYAAFKAKVVQVEPQGLTSDDELPPPPKPKDKLKRNASKATLTEADPVPMHKGMSRERSRSLTIEPPDRRSRSRSVSISAEEIKNIGGKRGGVAGNSRLFASEVEMRNKAGWSRTPSAGSTVGESTAGSVNTEGLGFHDCGRRVLIVTLGKKRRSTSPVTSMPSGTMLVAETPVRQNKIAAWISGGDDDFIVDDSP